MKDKVEFLPATNLVTDSPRDHEYFAVLCLNVILYLPNDDDKKRLVENLAQLSSYMIFLSYGGGPEQHGTRALAIETLGDLGFELDPKNNHLETLHADIFFKQPA